jgi:hypothetical protein
LQSVLGMTGISSNVVMSLGLDTKYQAAVTSGYMSLMDSDDFFCLGRRRGLDIVIPDNDVTSAIQVLPDKKYIIRVGIASNPTQQPLPLRNIWSLTVGSQASALIPGLMISTFRSTSLTSVSIAGWLVYSSIGL